MSELLAKIHAKSAKVVVIGAGYVGLPLLLECARAGFSALALDTNVERVRMLRAGRSYVPDVADAELAPELASGRLGATHDPAVLASADAVIVCVPTPLNKTRDPDIRHIVAATDEIVRHQHAGMLVVLESTSYPGTTCEVMVPKLTQRGFQLGKDVFVAFSPERVDPGNRVHTTRNTPKVLGGASPACLEVASVLYRQLVDRVVPVSSTETAEMVKLLENTFRAVNIALVNEIAIMSRKLGIDPFEVVRAAATKPFGFLPFYPGPGLGGHCLPIDPLYLSWKLRSLQYQARFIELADSVNGAMPSYVVERVAEALNEHKKPLREADILIYGVAYKRDVNDVRESPALDILRGLRRRGARVAYQDPLVPELSEEGLSLHSLPDDASFAPFDAVVVVTDHAALDRPRLLREARLIVDTRDAFHGVPGDRSRLYGL